MLNRLHNIIQIRISKNLLLVALMLIGSFMFADEVTKNLQSVVLEDFELSSDGTTPKRLWYANPSRFGWRYTRDKRVDFSSENGGNRQKLGWIKAWPEAYFGKEGVFDFGNRKETHQSCLALEMNFSRKGYNSVELYPLSYNTPYEFTAEEYEGKIYDAASDEQKERLDLWYEGYERRYDTGEFDDNDEKVYEYKNYYKLSYQLSEEEAEELWGIFDSVGYTDQKKYMKRPIEFKGRVEQIDMWIWGANYNYDVEVVVKDYKGYEHRLPLGNIKHVGWKNFVVQIPNHVPQSADYIPKKRVLSFVKLVIWTHPEEKATDATVYIDHIKYLSDIFESKYDGYNLGEPEQANELWKNSPDLSELTDDIVM